MRLLALGGCLCVAACSSSPRERGSSSDGGAGSEAGVADVYQPPPLVDGAPPYQGGPDVTPAARLLGDPLDLDLGTVNIGTGPKTGAVVITNIGDAVTLPLKASLTSSPTLTLTSNCMDRALMPEETCVVSASFDPTVVGPVLVMGTVDAQNGMPPVHFSVRGAGRAGPDAGPDVARPLVDGPLPDVAADLRVVPPDATLPADARPDAALPRDAAPPPADAAAPLDAAHD
jgi:hypothetical protein